MKKVLFVNSSLSFGGSERVMSLIANELAERGYNVEMTIFDNKITYQLSEKVKLTPIFVSAPIAILAKIKKIFQLRKVIKQGKYDYVVSFMQGINILTLLSCFFLNKKVIVSERCNPKERKNFIKNFLSDSLYLKSYKIVFQTNQVKDYYSEAIKKKSAVIPNPVNNQLPNPYKGIRKKKIVGIGRLTDQKNFKLLIKTFSLFSKKYNDYSLEIYGEGPLLEDLKKCAEENEVANKVHFMGFVSDVVDRMKDASMYVSTSNYEGISNTMIEALAMGVPTICTNCPVGGAEMMIQNNENGLLIPVNDGEALLEAMNKIIDDKDFADNISKKALEIRKDYSIEKIVDCWEELIK